MTAPRDSTGGLVHRAVPRAIRALGGRARALQRRVMEGVGAYVLLYHRVADVAVDPWGLAVSPAHFAEHLAVLRRRTHPMRLSDFVRARARGALPRNAVAVTFDDGYADNLHTALPLLAEYGVPATVFLATGYLGRAYWWDELQRLVLGAHTLPREIALDGWCPDGTPSAFRRVLDPATSAPRPASADHGWRAESGARDGRQALFLDLWEWCASLAPDARAGAIARLDAHLPVPPGDDAPRAMTAEEVRALVASGLVEVGAHTVTHPMLSRLDEAAQRAEIAGSRDAVGAILGTAPTSFSYPHGWWDAHSPAILRELGFELAGTSGNTAHDPGFRFDCRRPSEDALHVPRVPIEDLDGRAFRRRLRARFHS